MRGRVNHIHLSLYIYIYVLDMRKFDHGFKRRASGMWIP